MNVQINVQPAALIATAPADITIEDLNQHLHAHMLYLPIVPLQQGLTLADIVAHHSGGRYELRHGTIARYLRAATVQIETNNGPPRVLTLGGHTIKRATGYRLPQSLVGRTNHMNNGLGTGTETNTDTGTGTETSTVPWEAAYGNWKLIDLTMSLRPLPPTRRAALLDCPTLSSAHQLATSLAQTNLTLSSLALTSHQPPQQPLSTGPLLLVVLEGMPDVVARQLNIVQALASNAQAIVLDICDDMPQNPCPHWHVWEHLAHHWQDMSPRCSVPAKNGLFRSIHSGNGLMKKEQATANMATKRTLSLPHTAIAHFINRAHDITQRYNLHLHAWGDAGVGTLHTWLEAMPGTTITNGEMLQASHLVYHMPQPTPTSTTVSQSQTIVPASPSANILAQICAIVGKPYVLTQLEELGAYATDASIAQATGAPLAVVLPANTHEVAEVMRAAAAAHIPIVTRGAASGLAGGSTASEGALMLSLTRMQELHIFPDQMIAHAEAGVITTDIQQAAETYGLFYPPDPSSQTISTIGGNIACNAGGPRCVKYGVTADYVQSLTVVLPDGRMVHTGNRATTATHHSDAALMHLLIGSEGTLAIITEATLRLTHKPAHRRTAMALFERLEDACTAVETIIAAGVVPAALELMDSTTIAVVEDYVHMGLPRDAGALLIMMADGEPEAVDCESETMAAIAQRTHARSVRVANNADDEALLWRGRRSIGPALARVRPNRLPEDISVPVYQVAETVRRIKAIAECYGMPIPVFGHAGDGNLHPNVLFDARDAAQTARAWQAAEDVFGVALDVGGTLSGEHGIGMLKRTFIPTALGEHVLALQRAIKATFDPHNRMNPGKVLP